MKCLFSQIYNLHSDRAVLVSVLPDRTFHLKFLKKNFFFLWLIMLCDIQQIIILEMSWHVIRSWHCRFPGICRSTCCATYCILLSVFKVIHCTRHCLFVSSDWMFCDNGNTWEVTQLHSVAPQIKKSHATWKNLRNVQPWMIIENVIFKKWV
jgi:hypothetical protein